MFDDGSGLLLEGLHALDEDGLRVVGALDEFGAVVVAVAGGFGRVGVNVVDALTDGAGAAAGDAVEEFVVADDDVDGDDG